MMNSINYEFVKSFNLKQKFKLATSGKTIGKILDIGCGTGDFLLKAKQNNWEVSALEPNEHAREIASKRLNVSIIRPEDISGIPDSSFDVITMWHVLEHIENLQEEALHLHRMLKPGGRLVVAVPNNQSYDAKFYKDKWAAWDVPRHLNHFTQDCLQGILNANDFKYLDTQRLIWDAYYISFLSEKYLGHSLPLIRGAWVGLKSNYKARRSGM
jgi:2-polyprenyl-3-methyl-5-hydroxy-6-metoxy-1,4-benzoquinol methylase